MHYVTLVAGRVAEIFDDERRVPPAGALPVEADPAALAHGRHDELAVVDGRLVVDEARVGARREAAQQAAEARRAAIDQARADMAAASSVPALRDAVRALLELHGLA